MPGTGSKLKIETKRRKKKKQYFFFRSQTANPVSEALPGAAGHQQARPFFEYCGNWGYMIQMHKFKTFQTSDWGGG